MIHPIAAALCTAANSFLCTTQHLGTPGFAPSSPSLRLHLERVRLRTRHQRLEDSLSSRAMRFHLHRNVNIVDKFINTPRISRASGFTSSAILRRQYPRHSAFNILVINKEKKKVTAVPPGGGPVPNIPVFSNFNKRLFIPVLLLNQ